jgi:DNA-binding SARP family transcriptional activator/TolB-like protein
MTNVHHAGAPRSFRLLTLGGLSLVDSAGTVVVPQRRRLALLALLSSARDTGISRDRLIAYLSPESPAESARHSLHQLLYYLRQQTLDDVFLGTDPLRLNPLVMSSDRADFDAAIERGDRARAADLFRGPFLDGFHLNSVEFEEWAAAERARLAATHSDVLFHLAMQAQAASDHGAAIHWWRQLATIDPLSGRVALALMRSLADAGDTPGALRHAKQHQALTRAELGSDGDAQVSAFAAALQAGATGGRVPEIRAPDAAAEQSIVRQEPREIAPAAPVLVSGATAAPRGWRNARRTRTAAALGAALVLTIATATIRGRSSPSPDPGIVAVLPFRVAATDSVHEWLRDGMVELLTVRLYGDGKAGMHLADPGSVLRIWKSSAERRVAAPQVATALNATRVIDGSVIGTSRHVVLTASILSMPGSRVVAQASVEGHPDSVLVLVDRLAVQLLGLTAGIERDRLTALTSASLPAVRAYLKGRAAWRSGSAVEAAAAFREAVAQDSSFALAEIGLARAMLLVGGDVRDFDRLRSMAVANQGQLSGADRALLRVTRVRWDNWPEMFAEWNATAGAYPDLPDAWYGLGIAFLRFGALAGLDSALERADDAFRRGARLDSAALGDAALAPPDPILIEELLRMVEYAHVRGDTAEVRRLVSHARLSDSTSVQARALEWHLAFVDGDSSRRAFWNGIARVEPFGLQLIPCSSPGRA